MIKLKFVLVPVLMAFFLTFLMAPLLDLMEKRPYGFCGLDDNEDATPKSDDDDDDGEIEEEFVDDAPYTDGPEAFNDTYQMKMMCATAFTTEKRAQIVRKMNATKHHGFNADDAQLTITDLALMAKVPHGIACLLTLFLSFFILFILGTIIKLSFEGFLAEEQVKVDAGETPMGDRITAALNSGVETLDKDYGIKLVRERRCRHITAPIIVTQEENDEKNYVMNTYVYGIYKAESQIGEYIPHGYNSTTECDLMPLFGGGDGMPMDDLISYISLVFGIVNETILILLLAIYILLERPEGSTFDVQNRIGLEVEIMVKLYISLKTLLSVGTGILTALIMSICGVRLAPIFGLMAFLLNYIPTVGSMIACVLPLPVIMLDDGLAGWQKVIGFLGPASVQLYVGNFLEPSMFGEALNLTALSVLLALVFFGFIWGLSGAVLSVPLLGVVKIVCYNTEHPLCGYTLSLIREDVLIDVNNTKIHDATAKKHSKLQNFLEDLFSAEKAEFAEGEDDLEELARKKEEKQRRGEEARAASAARAGIVEKEGDDEAEGEDEPEAQDDDTNDVEETAAEDKLADEEDDDDDDSDDADENVLGEDVEK